MLKKVKKFFSTNYLLIAIMSLASFLRFFRINDLLGFWYDQGRDALVIWDMFHGIKFSLVGQMMGFTGILRGGWFYWLLTPFYALGRGNPIWPTFFLITTSVLAIFLLYKSGVEIGGKKVGIMSALVASVSIYVINASRWLSGTTPELFVSILLFWAVLKFLEKKNWAIPLIAFLVGMSFQFEGATEVYFVPALLLIFFINRKILPSFKTFVLAFVLFMIPAVPQIIFEFRHPGVLSGALYNFVFHEKTFTFRFWDIVRTRLPYYYGLFYSKFWLNQGILFAPFFVLFVFTLATKWKEFWLSSKFKMLFIFAVAPFIGTLFFISNLGAVYDYYFTAYYLIWILLFSFVLLSTSKGQLGRLIIAVFVAVLLVENAIGYKDSYFISLDDPTRTSFDGQLKAIDWIYKDAGNRDFNFDVYVPPVVPYEFDYFFKWYGNSKYGRIPIEKNIPLLYTVYEVDGYHPERLQAWLDRQKGIGKVLKEQRFGGITVQERQRILYK
ncbi:MAG: glycosyltransferase family 39 protein [Candidatus Woesebacteria bacterium]|nr:glycosyltransferase family 39 protein [Candidatus Woesebacteria bacterium]